MKIPPSVPEASCLGRNAIDSCKLSLLLISFALSQAVSAAAKPNFVVILTDDK